MKRAGAAGSRPRAAGFNGGIGGTGRGLGGAGGRARLPLRAAQGARRDRTGGGVDERKPALGGL